MASLRGSITTPDGRRAWGIVGAVSSGDHGMSVRLCVIAATRMQAIRTAREAGVEGVRTEADRVPPPEAVLAALDAPEGVSWQDWFGDREWQELGSMPR